MEVDVVEVAATPMVNVSMTLELNKLHEILKQFQILCNLSATGTL